MSDRDTAFVPMGRRFRGFLPVVIDVETGGFDASTDALLQIGAVILHMDSKGELYRDRSLSYQLEPFDGARLDPRSLAVNGIDPYHPLRLAVPERQGLEDLFKQVRSEVKANRCNRAILVGHNAAFDLAFLNSAVARNDVKRNPFHGFSCLDTVSFAAMAYGQTVLARAVQAANLSWDSSEAHSALYDAEKTAELFCTVINRWQACQALDEAFLREAGG